MATQLQIRRGTAAQVAAFTGAEGEIVYNSTNDSLHTNDGATAGGFELARADLNNVSDADLNAALTGNTLSALTITTLTAGAATFSGNITKSLAPTANGGMDVSDGTNALIAFGSGGFAANGGLATDGGIRTAANFVIATGAGAPERFRIAADGKIKIGNNIPMWSGSYGGALFLKGNNATGDRYAQLAIVDSAGSIAQQGLIIDNSGNLGLGVVPSAWNSNYVGLDVGSAGSFWGTKSGNTLVAMSDNSYLSANGFSYIARNAGVGSKYYQNAGAHYWETAAYASAGAVQTNTTLMQLNASGNVIHRMNSGSAISQYIEAGTSRGYIGTSNSLVSAGLTSMCFRGESGIILSIAGSQAVVIDASGNLTSTGNIIIDSPAGNPILNIIAAGGGGAAEVRLQTTGYTSAIYQYQGSVYHSTAAVRPATDNTTNLGGAAHRWNIIYCSNNVINTSDAREKTVVAKLTANEIEASKLLGKEIGTYKWLASIEEKGEGARTHIGMTVQRAIEIMESCDLDPIAYGFICYDEWEDDIAVEQPAIEAQDAVFDEDGKVVTPAIKAVDEITKTHALAGNRYGFRYDQLNQFIAAGFNARLEALEGA